MLLFEYDDAGRSAPRKNDCAIRAISIAAELPYDEVYEALGKPNTTNGIPWKVFHRYLRSLGWQPTCLTFRKDKKIPSTGRVILESRFHVAAVIDGVVHDTQDPATLYEVMRARYPRQLRREAEDWTACAWCYWTRTAPPSG